MYMYLFVIFLSRHLVN